MGDIDQQRRDKDKDKEKGDNTPPIIPNSPADTGDDCSVRVALRVRPLSSKELNERCEEVVRYIDKTAQVVVGKDQTFAFDYVFSNRSRQSEIYDQCVRPLVNSLFQGYNSTILAYGQTGSGKTHTMGSESTIGIELEHRGVIPRVIDEVFSMVDRVKMSKSVVLKVSFLELYNEEIRDMLSPDTGGMADGSSGGGGGLAIRETAAGEVCIPGLFEEVVRTRKQMEDALIKGSQSRTTGSTLMNNQSSRSHAIFTVIVEQRDLQPHEVVAEEGEDDAVPIVSSEEAVLLEGASVIRSKFHFVDLAGSERVKKTKAEGQRLKEGININSGLLALGNVISALGDTRRTTKPKHVPYRDSKLTRMLQSSLGGNSRTLMIACISPADSNFEETLNTLKYAYRARNIMNKPVVNVDPMTKQINLYKNQIQILRDELIKRNNYKESDIEELIGESSDVLSLPIPIHNDLQNHSSNQQQSSSSSSNSQSSNNNNKITNQSTPNHSTNINNIMMSPTHLNNLKFQENMRVSQLEFENNMLQEISNKITTKYKHLLAKYKGIEEAAYGFINGYSPSKDSSGDYLELFNQFDQLLNDNQQEITTTTTITDTMMIMENDEMIQDSFDNVDILGENEKLSDLNQYIVQKEEELELISKTQAQYQQMKEKYDSRLKELEVQLIEMKENREKELQSLETKKQPNSSGAASPEYESEKQRLTQYYERKLTELKNQLEAHMRSKKEHQRLLDLKNKSDEKIDNLSNDIREMKRQKSELLKRMRDEIKKKDDQKQVQTRELEALKKEHKKSEQLIDQLKNQSKKKDILLQKKLDESELIKKKLKDLETKPKVMTSSINSTNSTKINKNNSSFKSKSSTSTTLQSSNKPSSSSSTTTITTTKNQNQNQNNKFNQPNWREWLQNQINRNLAKNDLADTLDKYFSEKEMFVKESNRLRQQYSSAGNKMTRTEYNEQWSFIENNIRQQNEKISKLQKDLALVSEDCLDATEVMRKVSTTPYEKLPSLIQASFELCIEYAEVNRSTSIPLQIQSSNSYNQSNQLNNNNNNINNNNNNQFEMRTATSTLLDGIKAAKDQLVQQQQQQPIQDSKLFNSLQQDNIMINEEPNNNSTTPNNVYTPPTLTSTTSTHDFLREIEELQQKIRQSSLTFSPSDDNLYQSSQPPLTSTTSTSTTNSNSLIQNESSTSNPSSSSTTESKVDQLLDDLKLAKERSQNRVALRKNNIVPTIVTTSSSHPPQQSQQLPPFMSQSLPANLLGGDDDNLVFDQQLLDVDMDTKKLTNSPKGSLAKRSGLMGVSADNIVSPQNYSPTSVEADVFARLSAPRPDSRLKKYRDKLKGDVYHQSVASKRQDANDNFIRSNWSFTGHDGSVTCLVYSGNSNVNGNSNGDQSSSSSTDILYSGGQDKIIKLWDLNTGDCMGDLLGHSGPIRTITLHGSGQLFSGGSDRQVKVWDPRSRSAVDALKIPNELLCMMSYGNYVFGGLENSTVKVWDVRSMRSLKTPLAKRENSSGSVFSMTCTSKYIACGSRDHTVTLFHRDTLELVQKLQPLHLDGVNSLCVVGDDVLFSGSRDKTIKRWESLPTINTPPPNYVQTKIASNAHQDWVTSLASHNGILYSSGRDATIKGWEPLHLNASPTNHLLLGHESAINCIISTGNAILSGSSDKSIRLWRV